MHQLQTPVTAGTAMPRKAIQYSRFSGKRQEAGDSQRRQDAMAEQAAKEMGLAIDHTLSLSDKGVSGFRGANWKRGNLGKFVDLVDAGVIPAGSVLIIERVNRLSRMPWMDQVELWKEILSRGITIRTCEPAACYTSRNMNELGVGCPVVLYMMLGHMESEQKSQWLGAAWGQKKEAAQAENRPHGRKCPHWLEPVSVPHPKDPKRVVTTGYRLIEDRAQVLRQIYAWSVEDRYRWGGWRIHQELVRRGVPAWSKRGWTISHVRWLLRDPAVTGEYQPMARDKDGKRVPCGPPIPDYYPVAVPRETFLAHLALKRKRTKKGGRRGFSGADCNLFTHLVFEAVSRRAFRCVNSGNHHLGRRYLHTDPRTDGVPYKPFEQAVLEAISTLNAADVDGRHEADAVNALVEALQGDRTRLGLELDALDAQLRELPTERWPKRVVARMAELEEAVAAKDEELRVAKEAAATSTRTEALVEVKTCISLLDEVAGTPREAEVRARIKSRIPLLVESIWCRVQPVNLMNRYVHVQIYLRGGEQRYVLVRCGRGRISAEAWPLRRADFRAGDEAGSAVDAGGLDVLTQAVAG